MRSKEINHIMSSNKELIYTTEFKQLIHDNPGILASFNKISDILNNKETKEGEVFEEQNLKITVIGNVEWNEFGIWHRKGHYLKAEFAGEEFFIKTVPGYSKYATEGGGVEEFQSMQRAKELIGEQPDIEVIDFQLGYQDTNCNVSYFVSKWVNAIILNNYLEQIQSGEMTPDKEKEVSEILEKKERLEVLLNGEFWDIEGNHNVLYDPLSKKIIVFDIHSPANLRTRQKKKGF